MNKRAAWAGAIAAALLGLGAGLVIALSQSTVNGGGLAMLSGAQRDPHLLTAALWHAIARACAGSAPCIGSWNAAGFAIACGLTAYIAGAGTRRLLAALLCGAIAATSPLAAAFILDAGGIEIALAFCLFVAIAGAAARLWKPRPWIGLGLAAALTLQDPVFVPAALLYVAVERRRIALREWALAAIAALFFIRVAAGSPALSAVFRPQLDPWGSPATVLLIGMTLFVAVPAALWIAGRHVDEDAGFERRSFLLPFWLGAITMLAALVEWIGDPGPYWLAAEMALVLGIAGASVSPQAGRIRRLGSAAAVAAIALQVYAYPQASALPSVSIWRESKQLRGLIADRNVASVCVVGSDRALDAVLGGQALVRAYQLPAAKVRTDMTPQQCLAHAPAASVIYNVGYPQQSQLNFSLALAARMAGSAAVVLSDRTGSIAPATRHAAMPGGRGSYRSIVPTALGVTSAFTVASHFSYTFSCIQSRAGSALSFAAANPLAAIPGAGTVHFSVVLDSGGSRTQIVARDLPPTPGSAGIMDWQYFSVPLPPTNCASLTFAVSAATGNNVGTWTTFAAVAIGRRQ